MVKKSILLSVFVFLAIGVPSYAQDYDEAYKKKYRRTVKTYQKKIERAEEKSCYLNSKSDIQLIQKTCQRSIRLLDRTYNGYSNEKRNHPPIIRLRERHIKLQQQLTVIKGLTLVNKSTAGTKKVVQLDTAVKEGFEDLINEIKN